MPLSEDVAGNGDSMKTMTAMVSSMVKERPELLEMVGERLNVNPDVLAATLKNLEEGNIDSMPQEVLEKVDVVHRSMKSMNPMMMPSMDEYKDEASDLFEDERDQNIIHLYRTSFLAYTDLAFGPVFISLCALFFYLEVLPLGWALCVLPIACAVLGFLAHTKIAGLPHHMLPASRMAGSLVFSLEVMALIVFTHSFFDRVYVDLWPAALAMYTLTFIAITAHIWTWRSSPGYLPRGQPPPPMPFEQLLVLQKANPYNCVTCGIYKPIRSKHCTVCNRCVPEFDHHCPVVMNCIGEGNRRIFCIYIFSLFIAEVLWWLLSLEALKRLLIASAPSVIWPDPQQHPSFFQTIWRLGSISKIEIEDHVMTDSTAAGAGAVMMFLVVVPILLGTGFQVMRQIYCILAGLTPNELIVRAKYDYLKDKDLIFYNPFDLGPVENCMTYWSTARPSWYEIYSERTDLDPEKALPRMSFSNVLRLWDKSKKALNESRAKRAKEREERILRMFGGVTRDSNGAQTSHSCPHC